MSELNDHHPCPPSILTLLALSLLLPFIFIFRSRSRLSSRTPCPESYPIIGNLIGFLRNRHRFHDWVADMLVVAPSQTIEVNGFLGLSHGVCTANPSNLEYILRSNFPNYVKGHRFQSILIDLLGDGIFAADGELWSVQRKIASHEFSTKSLKNFISSTVQSHLSASLLPHLSVACHRIDGVDEIIDLQDVFRKFTFDNICSVAFGVDPSSLAPNSEDDSTVSMFVQAFDYAVGVCSDRFMAPLPAIWKLKRLFNIGSERKYREAISVINDFAMKIIRSKDRVGRNQEPSQDLLSRFMDSSLDLGFRDEDEKRKFLRDIIISFILAGKDSTSTALTWFFWLIAGHPPCERLICDELASAGSGNFSYDDLKRLNYLHAAISESLRLFPPVPINSKLVAEDDSLTDGTQLRKGWFADYSAYAMGRMEKVWGSDCREFKPERWLDADGVFRARDQFSFPVFHAGPRMCLGKEMAYVQMKCVAAAMMSEFEVLPVDGGGCAIKMKEPPYTLSLLLKMKGGFPVRLRRRR